jgi:hypothetical protein
MSGIRNPDSGSGNVLPAQSGESLSETLPFATLLPVNLEVAAYCVDDLLFIVKMRDHHTAKTWKPSHLPAGEKPEAGMFNGNGFHGTDSRATTATDAAVFIPFDRPAF